MSGINAKQVVKYVVLPGVLPRVGRLFTSGFSFIAVLMAQVYAMVRLLPAHHPYLDPQNNGKFGIRHVIAEAANNLVLSRNNIDQIIIFSLMLLAIVLFLAQILMLVASILFGSDIAFAAYPEGPSIFVTGRTDDDVAFMLLDRVFGIPNFFDSCVSSGVLCNDAQGNPIPGTNTAFPWPFHLALQELFKFYSLGMLLIGTIIFVYFVVVVVVETATTGSPFGQRFQNVWVPIRLVVAIGLLVPLNYGYNSGQYITFAAAKYGSSLATNGWIRFNNAIASSAEFGGGQFNPTGERSTLIALPEEPDMSIFTEALSIIHTCVFAHYWLDSNITVNVDPVPGKHRFRINFPWFLGSIDQYLATMDIKPYLLKTPQSWMTNQNPALVVAQGTTYDQARDFFQGGDIVITFGRDEDGNSSDTNYKVRPLCGQLRIPVADQRPSSTAAGNYLGVVEIQKFYFDLVKNYWFDRNEEFVSFAGRHTLFVNQKNMNGVQQYTPCSVTDPGTGFLPDTGTHPVENPKLNCDVVPPGAFWKQSVANLVQQDANNGIVNIWQNYNNDGGEIQTDPIVLDRGWGGAGIWFNKIAQVNGAWTVALMNQPVLDQYPLIMEEIKKIRGRNSSDTTGAQFSPVAADEAAGAMAASLKDTAAFAEPLSTVLYNVYQVWHKDQMNSLQEEREVSGDAVKNAMNMIFGTYGLFSMLDQNSHVHPLAQLTSLGKGLVEASIRNIAISTGSAALGGAVAGFAKMAGPLLQAGAGLFNSFAFIGLTAGLVLYYIVPFLPFLYFFFSVATWVKSIFEAMVGVPLWALAHLRLDGEGLPGDSASNGYFLIFEIFLRPILTVFGLIAAMVIFTAQVRVLNFLWMLVTENAGGTPAGGTAKVGGIISFDRDVIDQFFFTVTYAIVVYMMATAAFKLIDSIPDNILRWAGASVSAFSDINQDSVDQVSRYAALGGMTAGREAAGGIQQLGGGLGGAIGGLAGKAK